MGAEWLELEASRSLNLQSGTKVALFEHINHAGMPLEISGNSPAIPPPMGTNDGQASSLIIVNTGEWVAFWEAHNFDDGDDHLWIAPAPQGKYWKIPDLRNVPRPHGTNHWNDRIRGVSFSPTGPHGDAGNRTVINADGSVSMPRRGPLGGPPGGPGRP